MKQFENKGTGINLTNSDKEKSLTYVDLAILAMNSPKKQGTQIKMTSDQIRKDIKVLDKLDGAEQDCIIEFEDVEMETLLTHVRDIDQWPFRHKVIVEFEDYINSL